MDGRVPFDVSVGLLCSLPPTRPLLYLLISINAGHKPLKERLGVAFKVFYRSFICCLCPVIACCCYYYIGRKRRCILCTKDVKKIDRSHNSKCKSELEEKYNEIPDSPAFLCGKCNAPFKLWPKEKLALIHSLWCIRCEQVITNFREQNVHVCFLCDKMLCGLHIKLGPGNMGRTTIDWAFLENLHINSNYQDDLFIPPTTASVSVARGPEPSLHNPPVYNASGPSTTPRHFTPSAPSAPSPSVQHSSMLGFNPLPTESSMDHQSMLLPRVPARPEGSSHTSNEIYIDLPPSYDVAMQDED